MPRLRTVGIAAAVLVVLLVTASLVALPEIVRRVAIDQLTTRTGRAVSLERVELNPFTGRLALAKLRLAQRASKDAALEIDGLEVRLSLPSLVTRHARVASVTLTGPRVRVARLTPTEFDFSDLLALIPPADPNAKPSGRTVTIERVVLNGGDVVARDDVTASTWKLEGLAVDGTGLSTRGGPPGRLTVRAKLNGTPIALDAGAIDLAKGAGLIRVTVDGFDVAQVQPFVPASLGLIPAAGRASVSLDVKAEKGDPSPTIAVAGDATFDGLSIRRANDPIVNVGRVVVKIRDAQPLTRVIALDSVTIDGADLRVARLRDGRIDLLDLFSAKSSDAAPRAALGAGGGSGATREPPPPGVGSPGSRIAPEPPPAPSAALRVTLGQLSLNKSKVTMRDDVVNTTLALSDIAVSVRDVVWPAVASAAPSPFEIAMSLPTAGKLQVKGAATLAPITAEFTMSMRGAPIDPYQPYMPIPGRIVGTFNGESRSRVTIGSDGKLAMAVSQGRSWIDNLELRVPGSTTGPVKIAKVSIDGIDFTHPGRAAAKTITISKPDIRVERDASGEIDIRKLFAAETAPITTTRGVAGVAPAGVPAGPGGTREPPPPGVGSPGSRIPPGPAGAPAAAAFVSPLPLEIGAIVIDDGYARFIDRTTKPAFSEEVSKLALRIDGLSSQAGKRAKLALQAIVGGDSALDLKGEVAPFGDLYADVAGELRNFGLPSVNPYADNAIAWVIERGKLGVKLHYIVEKNQLIAQNEIIVENLHVARSRAEDEVQKRIGLPLGMIVALVTDSDNGIRVNLPMKGTLESWSADFSDAIWTVVKNAVVNIVASPFKAIGRMFTGSGDKIESVAIDPATFTVGSATIADGADAHLTKVADFLRKAPAIKLTLAPVTTAADAESLRAQELTARIQKVQREAKLADLDAAVAAEFKRVFPGEAPPKTSEERLARLRAHEPAPTDAVAELAGHRLRVVQAALTEKEGIPAARLVAGDATTAPAGDGRVEFRIGE